ncbi:beta-1 adrenergic receptor-like [Oculina patagonica]
MNQTKVNNTFLSCGSAFIPITISSTVYTVFIIRIVVNALTCPLIILLNILVMVAVKTKRQLRTKSNIALACLATTDLVVGLVVQPLQIACYIFLFHGETDVFCSLNAIAMGVTIRCVLASLNHLFLMSAERYVAIKRPFAYDNLVTEVRIVIASCLAWTVGILIPMEDLLLTEKRFLPTVLAVSVTLFLLFPAMIYFNVAVYKEIRRNATRIAANQVSLAAKKKLLKNKKAFYTKTLVLVVFFLCYIPGNICNAFTIFLEDRIAPNLRHVTYYLVTLLPVLNSLFNPLIYAVRMRYFRVAFIYLLSRKTAIAQAEGLERNIFASRRIGALAYDEQGQNGVSREEDEQLERIETNEE